MKFQVAENGDFMMAFRADEVELGLAILESMQPASEADSNAIQACIDQLLAGNNLHQYRTIN